MRALLALLVCALAPTSTAARPFTVEDLLSTESVGQVLIDPAEQWAVIEHRRPWREAAAFDLNLHTTARLTQLAYVDLRRPATATPLFDQTPDAGYLAGPIAPDGRHMLVYRLMARRYEAGILKLATRQVIWLPVTPDQPLYGRAAQWRSASTLVLLARADGDVPRQLAIPWRAGERVAAGRARTAAGQSPSRVRYGSGRFQSVRATRLPLLLLSVEADTGAIRTLAQGDFVDLEVSRSGRHVALLENRAETQDRPGDRVYSALPSRKRRLSLVDLDTGGLATPCGEAEATLLQLHWAPDREELLAALHPTGGAWDARQLTRVTPEACTRLETGDLTLTQDRSGEDHLYPRAVWMGSEVLAYARPSRGGRSDWYRLAASGPVKLTGGLPAPTPVLASLAPTRIGLVSAERLWTVDAAGQATAGPRTPRAVTVLRSVDGQARVRNDPTPPGPDAALVEDGGAKLVWRPPASPARQAGLPPDTDVLAVGRTFAIVLTRAANGERMVSLVSPRAQTPVLRLNAGYEAVTPATGIAVPHHGARGEPLTSWLYLPADRPANATLPLVVIPYRGHVFAAPPRHLALGEWNDSANAQLLVAAGYAVLAPSLPYTAGVDEPGAGLADDILRAVDAAVALGGLDPDRIALVGHSFGGRGVLLAAAQSSRFRSVIASAAVADDVANWAIFPLHQAAVPEDGYAPNLTNGHVEQAQASLGAPPWIDPERYRRASALFVADKITAPVLLLHGETDELGVFQSQAMFSALYRQGKDAQLVVYWGEGHNTASPANIRDRYKTILTWLATTLPPADASSGPTPPPSPRP